MENHRADANRTQRAYARLAGSFFLGVVILAFGGGFISSHVAGTFAETAASIAASPRLYRAGLSIVVLASLGSALPAFALYVTVKPANCLLALLAMISNSGIHDRSNP
jgi:hypothetical protein